MPTHAMSTHAMSPPGSKVDRSSIEASEPLVELRDIVKVFPGVGANDGVSFSVRAREVHGLLGENGAGKSTLMSILCGLYQPDAGTILRNGTPLRIPLPKAALQAGIAIVQQHFALVPTLSVSDNVILGDERGRWIRKRDIESRVRRLSELYDLELRPDSLISERSIGQRQRVEILKCLYRDPQVLIFDEPTTVLTPGEVERLFDTIRVLRDEGRGVVLITHKLDELLSVADRVECVFAEITWPSSTPRKDG